MSDVYGIKHIAFAVKSAEGALKRYQEVMGVGHGATVRELTRAGSREAHFMVGNVQYQLCESMTPDHRFARHIERHGESVHHICYSVADVHQAQAQALKAGATLKECKSCQITGIHEHPEGWIFFLEDGNVPGADVEIMQIYRNEAEVPDRFKDRFKAAI